MNRSGTVIYWFIVKFEKTIRGSNIESDFFFSGSNRDHRIPTTTQNYESLLILNKFFESNIWAEMIKVGKIGWERKGREGGREGEREKMEREGAERMRVWMWSSLKYIRMYEVLYWIMSMYFGTEQNFGLCLYISGLSKN